MANTYYSSLVVEFQHTCPNFLDFIDKLSTHTGMEFRIREEVKTNYGHGKEGMYAIAGLIPDRYGEDVTFFHVGVKNLRLNPIGYDAYKNKIRLWETFPIDDDVEFNTSSYLTAAILAVLESFGGKEIRYSVKLPNYAYLTYEEAIKQQF